MLSPGGVVRVTAATLAPELDSSPHPRLMLSTQQGEHPGCNADVAQLVEHHLAKVRVAGSSPVIRSEAPPRVGRASLRVAWPRGEAAACKIGRASCRGGV